MVKGSTNYEPCWYLRTDGCISLYDTLISSVSVHFRQFRRTLVPPGDTWQPMTSSNVFTFELINLVVEWTKPAKSFDEFSTCQPYLVLMSRINFGLRILSNNFDYNLWHCVIHLWDFVLIVNSSSGRLTLKRRVENGLLRHLFILKHERQVWSQAPQRHEATRQLNHRETESSRTPL